MSDKTSPYRMYRKTVPPFLAIPYCFGDGYCC